MVQLETAARLRQHWKEKGSPPAITRYWTRNKPPDTGQGINLWC